MQQSLAERVKELRQEIAALLYAHQCYAHRRDDPMRKDQKRRFTRLKEVREELRRLMPQAPATTAQTLKWN